MSGSAGIPVPSVRHRHMPDISPDELAERLQTDGDEPLVLDVRHAPEAAADALAELELGPNNCAAE